MGRIARQILLAGTLLAALAAGVPSAVAAPAPSVAASSALEAKQAERQAALAELESMRAQLSAQVNKYVSTGRRIQQTQRDVVDVNKEIVEQDASLARAEEALVDRAVQLYRTDRLGLMEILFSSDSIPQLMDRMSYLLAAGRHDRQLIEQVKLERQESLWLQQSLTERVQLLTELQSSADQQRSLIESDIAQQQERATSIGEDIARLLRAKAVAATAGAGSAPQSEFTPDTLLTQQRFEDVGAMSIEEIQAFLNDQPGTLKYYRGPDHAGVIRSAAEMIAEASAAWRVSPLVILVTLQKEQSLLSRGYPPAHTLDWAMGCGATDSGRIGRYSGFGNQIWYGAKSLRTNANRWQPGTRITIDGSVVMPSNPATYGLYKYTPHIRGNVSFWMLYWRYFGDPLSLPVVMRP